MGTDIRMDLIVLEHLKWKAASILIIWLLGVCFSPKP